MAAVDLLYAALADPLKRPAALQALQDLMRKLESGDMELYSCALFVHAFTMLDALDPAYDLANRSLDQLARGGTVGGIWGWMWVSEMRPFRKDPRFQTFVTRLRLMDYWKQYGPPDDCDLKDGMLTCR